MTRGDGAQGDDITASFTIDGGILSNSDLNFAADLLTATGNGVVDRSKPGYTRLGDVWATLLAASGQPFDGFGMPVNGVAHKPIEQFLA